jgi:hypothetical protein
MMQNAHLLISDNLCPEQTAKKNNDTFHPASLRK